MPIQSLNPANGRLERVFEPLSEGAVEARLALSWEAYKSYRNSTLEARSSGLARAAAILESERERLGRMMTAEMGKPLAAAIAEAEKCATACRYYSENGTRLLTDRPIKSNAIRSGIRFNSIGPVLAVMPWNFPFWQVFRFAAPALMAGNTGLLKHASNVPQCALAIEEIFEQAGFSPGVFQTLLIGSDQVGSVIADRRVAAVTLTGSDTAGSLVAGAAGKAIKKTVLELGGSDPFIVMPGADIARAAATAVKARTVNNGQSCIAAKRFIVADGVYAEFEQRFTAAMRALRVGDPMDPATDIGPLATRQIVTDLEQQVRRAVADGARVLTGGEAIAGDGFYFQPTVLAAGDRQSPVYGEETFGPVAILFRVRDIGEAIELANATDFGLGASAWTNDPAEQERFIDELEAGLVFINGMVASDARLPFGGVKRSGYGRELSEAGLYEFMNIKTYCIYE